MTNYSKPSEKEGEAGGLEASLHGIDRGQAIAIYAVRPRERSLDLANPRIVIATGFQRVCSQFIF